MNKTETAVFGGGCFWCTEAIFKSLKGILSVTPGYAGGHTHVPVYYEVAAGETGHAEVIRIEFDPQIISYEDLLDVFWNTHNPTTHNQQGSDYGTQYRSVIFYLSEDQKYIAEQSMKKLRSMHVYENAIVTEIIPLNRFYEAESYHKDYYTKHKDEPYCQLVISPKLQHLREKYLNKLK